MSAALAGIDRRRLALLEARTRQTNHELGEQLATVAQILCRHLPGEVVIGACPRFAADEVRASLWLTRRAAIRLCELVWDAGWMPWPPRPKRPGTPIGWTIYGLTCSSGCSRADTPA